MRGASLVLGTLIALTIAAASQAAMSADMQVAVTRASEREIALHQDLDRVWYGGVLPPVVVVAPHKAPTATARMQPRYRVAPQAPRGAAARIG